MKQNQQILRRTQLINDTKIQYLSVADKIYQVTDIDFCNLMIKAIQTDLSIAEVPEDEVFPAETFREFRIRLCNGGGGMGEVIDFAKWVKNYNLKT